MVSKGLPIRRGSGRATQQDKPGDVIRTICVRKKTAITIGECHREYSHLRLERWQKNKIAELLKVKPDDVILLSGALRSLAEDRAAYLYGRSPQRQLSFVNRVTKTIDKTILPKKRAPGTVTYANFARFFHFLVQLGYIEYFGTVGRERTAPEMRGADGQAILDTYTRAKGGALAKSQIEPPVLFQITNLGLKVADWNNPRKALP